MKVELLFFEGCPHVEGARSQLRRAGVAWTEVEVAAAPEAVRGYGSPTILVDGRDVMGEAPAGARSCRIYSGSEVSGAPPLSSILRALGR